MYGKELKIKRNLVGLTQEELANRVGITKQRISQYESGEMPPKPIERVIDYEIGNAFIEWTVV